MRIAVVNWSNRKVGGVETYLSSVIPELRRSGHELAFMHEIEEPANRDRIALPQGVVSWCVSNSDAAATLVALRDWRPDLIYTHGLLSPTLEAAIIRIAPSILFAHNYYGTCISGSKTFKYPVVRPCDRRFGVKCLLHYFPYRCGGWDPVTMLKLYRRQGQRLKLLPSYKAIVTHSEHMREEYIKHGVEPHRIYDLLYYVRASNECVRPLEHFPRLVNITNRRQTTSNGKRREWRLLFLGRMDFLKGGSVFLEALPQVSMTLGQPMRITFGGDGTERRVWERKAEAVKARHPNLRIDFNGWVDGAQLDSLIHDCDLLVLPSLWPEPFGLVGPEAGLRGVPVAAFAVGGIPDWLIDGVNGHIASGDPPTASGLAEAIIKCLRDRATHARLGQGAIKIAQRFEMQTHMSALIEVFEKVMCETD